MNLQKWIFSKGLKNELEIAAANEPSVFETLKVYCIITEIAITKATIQVNANIPLSY